MNEIELVLLLLVVVAALTPVARKMRVPYPVLLVVGGLVLALIPIVPDIQLTPELVFLLFLPPLVFRAAFLTSVRDFRLLLRPILSLAVGLVLATTVVVAVVVHAVMPQLGWPVAFAFGAIVSPPDAVAAAAIFLGLGVPRKLVLLLEGESLINDATALVAYRAALGAITVAFSARDASIQVALVGIGGVIVGLAVGVVSAWLVRRINDPSVEITLSLLVPFAAYLPAESLGVSGILATVAAGLYLGPRSTYFWGSDERIRARAVWDIADFILNGLVFILIGLQLSSVLAALQGPSILPLIGLGLLISLSLIVVRIVWVFLDARLGVWLWGFMSSRRAGRGGSTPTHPNRTSNWREVLVVSWAGMRGVVSLAVVLSLPAATPERNALIFLTFFVILVTLVGQGVSLPLLIRWLHVGGDGDILVQQELRARRTATEAAIERIGQLRDEWPAHLPLLDTLRVQYDHRASHLEETRGRNGSGGEEDDGLAAEEENYQELLEHHLIRRAVLGAERAAVLDMRDRGEIVNEVWLEIERDLDLEELRMDA
jgi:CPA1 family monovalent cation:H+ antiporter